MADRERMSDADFEWLFMVIATCSDGGPYDKIVAEARRAREAEAALWVCLATFKALHDAVIFAHNECDNNADCKVCDALDDIRIPPETGIKL
mgnify:CR=1 FL=1